MEDHILNIKKIKYDDCNIYTWDMDDENLEAISIIWKPEPKCKVKMNLYIKDDEVEIADFYVSEQFRSKGYGGKLLTDLSKTLKDVNIVASLEIKGELGKRMNFYKKHEFLFKKITMEKDGIEITKSSEEETDNNITKDMMTLNDKGYYFKKIIMFKNV